MERDIYGSKREGELMQSEGWEKDGREPRGKGEREILMGYREIERRTQTNQGNGEKVSFERKGTEADRGYRVRRSLVQCERHEQDRDVRVVEARNSRPIWSMRGRWMLKVITEGERDSLLGWAKRGESVAVEEERHRLGLAGENARERDEERERVGSRCSLSASRTDGAREGERRKHTCAVTSEREREGKKRDSAIPWATERRKRRKRAARASRTKRDDALRRRRSRAAREGKRRQQYADILPASWTRTEHTSQKLLDQNKASSKKDTGRIIHKIIYKLREINQHNTREHLPQYQKQETYSGTTPKSIGERAKSRVPMNSPESYPHGIKRQNRNKTTKSKNRRHDGQLEKPVQNQRTREQRQNGLERTKIQGP
ncbi:hypothetical protein KM043_007525 [Ampulex compressa]|nr:hypothetical protein KM043_007525 [Ampulex compressa]